MISEPNRHLTTKEGSRGQDYLYMQVGAVPCLPKSGRFDCSDFYAPYEFTNKSIRRSQSYSSSLVALPPPRRRRPGAIATARQHLSSYLIHTSSPRVVGSTFLVNTTRRIADSNSLSAHRLLPRFCFCQPNRCRLWKLGLSKWTVNGLAVVNSPTRNSL
jgi:hypothetical protein